MDIVMTRKTLWQNLIIPIGAEFSAPDDIAVGLIRRNVAIGKIAVPVDVMPEPAFQKKPKSK